MRFTNRSHSKNVLLMALFLFGSLAPDSREALADGRITGHARFEKIKGRASMGHVELYESNLFLSPLDGTTRGPSFRLGAPPGSPPRGDGYYSLEVPAGSWTAYVNQPLFFIAPKIIPGVEVREGQTRQKNIELSIDYSTYFTKTWTNWDDVWIQTFEATGSSIIGLSWKLAGTDASTMRASIHRDNGTANPSSWPLVSAGASKIDSVGSNTDNWVRWRSGEVLTTPGTKYAIKLSGIGGGFAVYKRDKDNSSYANGRAYDKGGSPQPMDLNITVFTEDDDTAVLYNKRTEGLGELRDGYYGGRWGQTFRVVRSSSLAAVDVWAAGADRHWDLDFTWIVKEGGPGGARVGPRKTTKAAFQAFGAGLHAVSYHPGEVPLEAGRTYYIEFTNAEGFNPYVMNDDSYDSGDAFQDGTRRGGVDLSMTIVTYTRSGGKILGRIRDADGGRPLSGVSVSITELGIAASSDEEGSYELRDVPAGNYTLRAARSGFRTGSRSDVVVFKDGEVIVDFEIDALDCRARFRNESFEQQLSGWARYGDARGEVVDTGGGGWFGGIDAMDGSAFHGNAINGCCLEGGLWQQFCSRVGHRYEVSVWSNIYWRGGNSSQATSRLGLDAQGGRDPASGLIAWSRADRQPRESEEGWRRLVIEAEASGPLMTIFLDFSQVSGGGDQWRINCFDLVEIEDLDAGIDFRRGDCDSSRGIDITDAIFLLNYLFQGGSGPGCENACDGNDDGARDISDATYLLNYLFLGGASPPSPGTQCGPDPTMDDLVCVESPC